MSNKTLEQAKKVVKDNDLTTKYSKINIEVWRELSSIRKCHFGCKKFKEPMFIGFEEYPGIKKLNPKYLFHVKETHGLPPEILVDFIADQLYKDDEDKQKFRNLYKFLEKY